MPKYSTLKSSDSSSVYFDEFERKDALGQPQFGVCDWIIWMFVFLIWVISLPVTWWCSFKIITQFERVLIFRLGRVLPLKGPGLIYVIPCIDRWKKVDMRMRAFKVAPQEIITSDRGVIKVGGDVQYRIADPIVANTMIKDLDHSLRVSGHSALNAQLCYEKLSTIQNEKVYLQTKLQNQMHKAVSDWGIEIARFELTHSVVIKGPGGADPNEENNQDGGGAAIMNLIKSFTSPSSSSSSSFMMPGMIPGMTPGAIPTNLMSQISAPSGQSTQHEIPLLKPEELFCMLKGIIDAELCLQVQAIYEFHIADEIKEKQWTIDLKNAPGCVITGPSALRTDVKFTLSDEHFQKIFYGVLSPTDAYMNGSLTIDGSLQTAMKLEKLVSKLKGT